jgi:hypothetical protein
MLKSISSFGLLIWVTKVEMRAKNIWDEVMIYEEHVGKLIGNTL